MYLRIKIGEGFVQVQNESLALIGVPDNVMLKLKVLMIANIRSDLKCNSLSIAIFILG